MKLRSACIALLFLRSAVAFGDDADEARKHFQRANAHYAVAEFAEAADEYQAAYKLKPDPALLFNAAQSNRLAGRLEKAMFLYRNYLQFYPNDENTAAVRDQIARLREAIDRQKTAGRTEAAPVPPRPEAPRPEVAPPKPEPDRVEPPKASVPSPALTPVSAPPPVQAHKPVTKKAWFWVTVVGAVVVVGGAITAAVLLTQPPPTWNNLPEFGPGSRSGARP